MRKLLLFPFVFILCFFLFSSNSRAQWTYYPQCTCDEYDPTGSPCLTYAYVCYNEKQDFTYETSGYTRGNWRFTAIVYNPCNVETDTKIRYGFTGTAQEIYISEVAVDTVSIPPNSSKNFYKTLTFDAWWSCDYYYSYGCVSLLVNKQNQLFWGRGSYEVRTDQVPACPVGPTATPTPIPPACPSTISQEVADGAYNLGTTYSAGASVDFTPSFTAGVQVIDVKAGTWSGSATLTCKLEAPGSVLLGETETSPFSGAGDWRTLTFSSVMNLTTGTTYTLFCRKTILPNFSAYWNYRVSDGTKTYRFHMDICLGITPTPVLTATPILTPTPTCVSSAPDQPQLGTPIESARLLTDSVTLSWNPLISWGNGCPNNNRFKVYLTTSSSAAADGNLSNDGLTAVCDVDWGTLTCLQTGLGN